MPKCWAFRFQEAQRIENPVEIRNGTATVSVETSHKTKVGH